MKVLARSLPWFTALCAAALLSCAKDAMVPEAPMAPPPPPPSAEQKSAPDSASTMTDLDALEHDLIVSEARLDEQLTRNDAYAKELFEVQKDAPGKSPSPAGTATATATPVAPRPPPTSAQPPKRELTRDEQMANGSPCDMACKALASMQRSVDGICRLAGEEHERCRSARDRAQRAAERVAKAGCACMATREE